MIKNIFFVVLFTTLFFFVFRFFYETDERRVQKKTEQLIQLGSLKHNTSRLSLLNKVSEVEKFIRFDVHLKVEYRGTVYSADSLNEFRSLVLAYFKLSGQGSYRL